MSRINAIVMTLAVLGMFVVMCATGTAHEDERSVAEMNSELDSMSAHVTALGLYVQSPAYHAEEKRIIDEFIYWAAWNGHY